MTPFLVPIVLIIQVISIWIISAKIDKIHREFIESRKYASIRQIEISYCLQTMIRHLPSHQDLAKLMNIINDMSK